MRRFAEDIQRTHRGAGEKLCSGHGDDTAGIIEIRGR